MSSRPLLFRSSFSLVRGRCAAASVAVLVLLACLGQQASAQTVTPLYADAYTLTNLGSVNGVPPNYGGLAVDPANTNILYLGGAANGSNGAIYAVTLIRNSSGQITGFGPVTLRAAAPFIDGGLAVGPGGVLIYAGYPVNEIGQILPSSAAPDRRTAMSSLGVPSSLGAFAIVPNGFPGAGRWKTATYNGGAWCDLAVTGPDNTGLFTITGATLIAGSTLVGPEGIAYIPRCSSLLPGPSIVVTEYAAGRVSIYDVDSAGDPIWSSGRIFVSGLGGAEGATIDPVTGDFLFSTFGGGSQVIRVSGFAAFRCLADVIGPGGTGCDQTVDGDDFIAFINSFSIGDVAIDPIADVVLDGIIDGNDFIAFINAFAGGC